jgi:NADH-dependent peroxiredoxin subunit F
MELHFDLGLNNPKQEDKVEEIPSTVDVAIIGGGPAGISAAIYARRKGLTTLVITETTGGQVNDTSTVENYPGFTTISGEALGKKFHEQARELGVLFLKNVMVQQIIPAANNPKTIILTNGKEYRANAVIIATGSRHRKLGVPGEDALAGKGVAYCAICDGPLFQGRHVVVAGGGNAAVEAAIDLSKIAAQVTLVHRSQFRADQILLDRMNRIGNIDVHLDTQITAILGEQKVTGIAVRNQVTKEVSELKADGVFVEIGYSPNTQLAAGLIDMNEKGEILVNHKMQTSLTGVFAAGDVVEGPYKQIVIAAGDGAKAALSANEYINTMTKEEEINHEIA